MVRVKADDISMFKRKKRFKRGGGQLSISERIAELERGVSELEKAIKEMKKIRL